MIEAPILVAGGGIGGLSTAIALARAGQRVVLVERAAEFQPIGYGIQLGPNALHAFRHLGLLDRVLSFSSMPDVGILSDAINNDSLAELPMAAEMIARFGQPYAVIHRGDLHEVLVDACLAHDLIELRNGFEVADFMDDGAQVSMTSVTGETLTGKALVAADGIWSVIRPKLFPGSAAPFTSRYAAFRCVCPIDRVDPIFRRNVVNLRCATNAHMIHYPLRNGTLFNLVSVVEVPQPIAMDDQAAVTAHFEQAYDDACDEVRELQKLVDRSRYWAISNVTPLTQWTRGRVGMIGDAAHAMVQAMAQGACQAIEDGIVLAKHFSAAGSVEQVFAGYEAERRARASYVQYRSLFMWELIHATGGWRDLRRARLETMTRTDVLSHVDWLYSAAPGSELAAEMTPLRSERHRTAAE